MARGGLPGETDIHRRNRYPKYQVMGTNKRAAPSVAQTLFPIVSTILSETTVAI